MIKAKAVNKAFRGRAKVDAFSTRLQSAVRGNGLGLQNRRNIVFMKVNNQHHPTLLTSKEHSLSSEKCSLKLL